mmetsp:Transcript_6269/g.15785  ORF Transcript_6269/g.15785 Transcript_6269/m.15785 type:complete len:180 (+) Transcript_6269:1864-2403(+)
MIRAILYTLALGLGATSAFQAPGRLTAGWSATSHLSTSQQLLARTTATELKSTTMNYANYAQPSIRNQRLMNQRGPSQVFGGTFSSGLVGYNNNQNGNYPQVYNNGFDGVMTRRERMAATHIPTGAAGYYRGMGFGPFAGGYGQVGLGGGYGYSGYGRRMGYGGGYGYGMGYGGGYGYV